MFVRANCYYKIHNFERAKYDFEELYKIEGHAEFLRYIQICNEGIGGPTIEEHLNQLKVLWKQDKYFEAQKILDRIEINQKTSDFLKLEILLMKARSFLQSEKFYEAINTCVQAIHLEKDILETKSVQINTVSILFHVHALKLFNDKLFLQKTMLSEVYNIAGLSHFNLKNYQEAKKKFKKSDELYPSESLKNNIKKCDHFAYQIFVREKLEVASSQTERKRYKEALDTLSQIDSNNLDKDLKAKFLYQKGLISFTSKRFLDASMVLDRALLYTTGQESNRIQILLAQIYLKTKNYNKVTEECEKIPKNSPYHEEANQLCKDVVKV